jgi:hypothetical protein
MIDHLVFLVSIKLFVIESLDSHIIKLYNKSMKYHIPTKYQEFYVLLGKSQKGPFFGRSTSIFLNPKIWENILPEFWRIKDISTPQHLPEKTEISTIIQYGGISYFKHTPTTKVFSIYTKPQLQIQRLKEWRESYKLPPRKKPSQLEELLQKEDVMEKYFPKENALTLDQLRYAFEDASMGYIIDEVDYWDRSQFNTIKRKSCAQPSIFQNPNQNSYNENFRTNKI